MIDTNDVYRKIKEVSKRTANPRPQVLINELAGEMMLRSEQILPRLIELKNLRLIQYEPKSAYIKLTLLGNSVNR